MKSTSAEATISKLLTLFATHRLPEQIMTDNAAGFRIRSEEFEKFTRLNSIKHIFLSPYHPSSNCQAEHAVQMVKSGISKLPGPIRNRPLQFLTKYHVTSVYIGDLASWVVVWKEALYPFGSPTPKHVSGHSFSGRRESPAVHQENFSQVTSCLPDYIKDFDFSQNLAWYTPEEVAHAS